jgi:hypothetical protein
MANIQRTNFGSDPLEGVLEAARERISDADAVHRLRGSVRRRIESQRRKAQRGARAAALVAGIALAGIGTAIVGSDPSGGALRSVPGKAVVTRTAEGAVRIEFADGKDVHRVVRKMVAASGPQAAVVSEARHEIRGSVYIDAEAQLTPGSIVFYAID